ncbi:hypothetical protein ACS0TY_016955 [Phlomoides rotata]
MDIVANPHKNSKIHVWKKEYKTLSDLLSKSGIGWDSSTSTLDIIDESADPHVKSMYFKSWPYYEHWLDIFGKDRATGETGAKYNIVTGEAGGIENGVVGENENIPENKSVCKPSPESGGVTSNGKRERVQ